METNTERQMLLWNAWYREDLDTPDKGEFYLMQIAAEVRVLREQVACLFGGKGREVKIMDFHMTFKVPEQDLFLTQEKAAAVSKQVWLGAMGGGVTERRVSRADGEKIRQETLEEYKSWQARLS